MTDEVENLVARLITANTATLQSEIQTLKNTLQALTNSNVVTEYKTQTIDDQITCTECLDVIKSLPEFSGININSYVSWREAANNSISLYIKGSRRYFAALTILRNKITHSANDVLTNHGTVLNYDAIIARLDFAYADKRPAHIIEQELSILRQGSMSIIDFYNEVNKKLTLLINKTIMTHGTESSLTKELNLANRRNALRIFITGLNGPLSNILFSLSPDDLPSALAKAQELESNNMRANFALQFDNHNKQHIRHNNNNLRFPTRNNNQQPKFNNPEPMELGSSAHRPITWHDQRRFENQKRNYNPFNQNNGNNNFQNNANQPRWQKPTYNTYNNPQRPVFKRERENSLQQSLQKPPQKMERVNNINEEAFLDQRQDYPSFTEMVLSEEN